MHALSHPHHLALAQLSQSASLPQVSRWALRVAYLILIWTRRSRTRAHLRRLDAAALRDIGLGPACAHAECLKWFWRP